MGQSKKSASSSVTPRKGLWQMRVRPRTRLCSQGLVTGSQKSRSFGWLGRVEGQVKALAGLTQLLVDELATDLVLLCQVGDALAGQGSHGDLATLLGTQ